jgi:hypothetical protein
MSNVEPEDRDEVSIRERAYFLWLSEAEPEAP